MIKLKNTNGLKKDKEKDFFLASLRFTIWIAAIGLILCCVMLTMDY